MFFTMLRLMVQALTIENPLDQVNSLTTITTICRTMRLKTLKTVVVECKLLWSRTGLTQLLPSPLPSELWLTQSQITFCTGLSSALTSTQLTEPTRKFRKWLRRASTRESTWDHTWCTIPMLLSLTTVLPRSLMSSDSCTWDTCQSLVVPMENSEVWSQDKTYSNTCPYESLIYSLTSIFFTCI